MRKALAILLAAAVLPAPEAASAARYAAGRGRGVPAPMGVIEARSIQTSLASIDARAFAAFPGVMIVVDGLRELDISSAEQRALLEPLRQALATDARTVAAVAAVAARVERDLRDATAQADAAVSERDVAAAATRLDRMQAIVAVYHPRGIEPMNAARALARSRLVEMRVEEMAASWGRAVDDARDDRRAQVVGEFIAALGRSLGGRRSSSEVEALKRVAIGREESVQNAVIDGFIRELTASYNDEHSMRVAAALASIARETPQERLQLKIVDALMDDVFGLSKTARAEAALAEVERVAAAALSRRVQQRARRLMLSEARAQKSSDYKTFVRERISAIERLPPAPVLPAYRRPSSGGIFAQATQAIKDHPLGSAYSLGAILVVVSGMPALPARFYAAGLLAYMSVKGVSRHHPAANFVQVLAIGSVLRQPHASLPLMLLTATAAFVAVLSYKTDRPLKGLAYTLAIVAILNLATG